MDARSFFNRCLLNTYYGSGAGVTAENRTKAPALPKVTFKPGGDENTQSSEYHFLGRGRVCGEKVG